MTPLDRDFGHPQGLGMPTAVRTNGRKAYRSPIRERPGFFMPCRCAGPRYADRRDGTGPPMEPMCPAMCMTVELVLHVALVILPKYWS